MDDGEVFLFKSSKNSLSCSNLGQDIPKIRKAKKHSVKISKEELLSCVISLEDILSHRTKYLLPTKADEEVLLNKKDKRRSKRRCRSKRVNKKQASTTEMTLLTSGTQAQETN